MIVFNVPECAELSASDFHWEMIDMGAITKVERFLTEVGARQEWMSDNISMVLPRPISTVR